MTFLEFLCAELLGPPTFVRGDGESHWPCPQCDSRKFHTRPARPGLKDRFSCWSCNWWGDEADLLKHFFPEETYDDRLERLDAYREVYRRQGAAGRQLTPGREEAPPTPDPAPCPACGHAVPGGQASLLPRGSGREEADDTDLYRTLAGDKDLRRKIDAAWADLTPGERMHLAAAHCIARRHEVPTAVLARYAYEMIEWWREADRRHFESCDDPKCEAVVCRAARGLPPLPPLTPEQARAAREARRDDSHVRAAASYPRRLRKLIAEANKEADAGTGQGGEDV
jgi:hypothetical protein